MCCLCLILEFLAALALPLSSMQESYAKLFSEYNPIVETTIDLKGDTLKLKSDSILSITSGGRIINGVIKGNNSRLVIEGHNNLGVTLIGEWIMPNISDDFFDDRILSDDDIICSINSLMSNNEHNSIILNKDYCIGIYEESGYGLDIKSNTDVVINGTIRLKPNKWKHYYIIQIKERSNVTIIGGTIMGDVGMHEYVPKSSSEWGMGFYIFNSHNINIQDSRVSLCTGDGIYIGGGVEKSMDIYTKASDNIVLAGIVSDSNRRQGLSITHAQDVTVKNCVFSNTGQVERTAPASGIDIEPNRRQSVRNVLISNCRFDNNNNYALVSGGTYRVSPGKADTYNISIKDCDINGIVYICNGATQIDNCDIYYLKLRDTDMPKGIIEVLNSTIYNGLYIGSTKLKDRIESNPQIVFRNSKILKNRGGPNPKSLLTVDLRDDVRTSIKFDGCFLSVPTSINCRFFSGSTSLQCTFIHCVIDLTDKELISNGAHYSDSVLKCRYIGIKSKDGMCDIFNGCRIDTSDEDTVFWVYDNHKQNTIDFQLLNCKVNNTSAYPFSLKTNRKSNLTCRVVDNSFHLDNTSLLKAKYESLIVR